ncbi:MAG: heavy-metal-associated domain-containing protein [Thermoplasmata archaeon]
MRRKPQRHDPPTGGGAGGSEEPRRLRIRIAYMHCKGCAATVESSLRRVPGVLDVSVDFPKEEGRILYDATTTDPDTILGDPIFKEPSPFEAEVRHDPEA